MTLSLELDDRGNLWLIEESDIAVVDTLLGPVDDTATSYRVPGELLNEWSRLQIAWAEAVRSRLRAGPRRSIHIRGRHEQRKRLDELERQIAGHAPEPGPKPEPEPEEI